MRTIKTSAGTPIDLDGDVLAVLEAVSRDLWRRQELEYGFEDVDREFAHLVTQMTESDLRVYLKESLFMSFNRYENDQLATLIRRAATEQERRRAGRLAGPRRQRRASAPSAKPLVLRRAVRRHLRGRSRSPRPGPRSRLGHRSRSRPRRPPLDAWGHAPPRHHPPGLPPRRRAPRPSCRCAMHRTSRDRAPEQVASGRSLVRPAPAVLCRAVRSRPQTPTRTADSRRHRNVRSASCRVLDGTTGEF